MLWRLNQLWTVNTALVFPIVLMGLLTIILVTVTASTYRKHTLEDSRAATSELVQLEAGELLDENLAVTNELAQSLNAAGFKKSIMARDAAAIQNYLDSNFSRHFVTAGIVKLEKLYAYDNDLELISSSSKGSVPDDEIVCPELRARASARSGASRLAAINQLCTHGQQPYLSVIVPVGGLKPIGYIHAVSDPRHYLRRIETRLGASIRIRVDNNATVFQSPHWPETRSDIENHIISSTVIHNAAGQAVLTIETSRDISRHNEELGQIRNNILLIAGIITLIMGAVALMLMRYSTINPVRRLMHHAQVYSKENIKLDKQAAISGAREIRALGGSFNQMTHRMSKLYHGLSSSYDSLASEITERKAIEVKLQQAHDALANKVSELNEQALNLKQLNEKLINENQQRILAERKLIQARDNAESANREKSRFLARMSHELRTPLNGILGYAQLITMKAKNTDDEPAEWARRIYDSGQYLLSLVEEVLDLSSIEAGKMKIDIKPLELMPLLREYLQVTLPDAEKRGINVIFEPVNCDENLTINADSLRLKQILLNLLSNAVKFNSEGGNLTLACSTDTPGRVRISISDTGEGLDKTAQEKLFIPFNRLDADKKCIPGTGVGLAVSRQLTELMHGRIGLESEPGKGSTFWVEFDR